MSQKFAIFVKQKTLASGVEFLNVKLEIASHLKHTQPKFPVSQHHVGTKGEELEMRFSRI